MAQHAKGTFKVAMQPLTPPPAEGLGRFSINKTIIGDLEATTVGEMFSSGAPADGNAGYVAIEVVTGKLHGKGGSFTMLHTGTILNGERTLSVIVVPGSGKDDLKGISGKFDIKIENGVHSYDFEYTLPH
eukprot:Phypoly_transcript_19399.p1 GENE.Phypoly_transcript_19399~~Phypoly_transcript_19399.p1  ORF type:complete len:130 (-),score=25.61 Phypoly_transcript_19399:78-467(-)